MSKLSERVDRGVERLNSMYPNWREGINADVLDVRDSSTCILGQLYGYYPKGRLTLGLSQDVAHLFGFDFSDDEKADIRRQAKLTVEWKKRLEAPK